MYVECASVQDSGTQQFLKPVIRCVPNNQFLPTDQQTRPTDHILTCKTSTSYLQQRESLNSSSYKKILLICLPAKILPAKILHQRKAQTYLTVGPVTY